MGNEPTLLHRGESEPTKRRRRSRSSEPRKSKSVRSTVLYGTLAIGALVTGGVLATPKVLDLLNQSKAGVPETNHQANQLVPISPNAANQDAISALAREEALPLGPADGHLVNNSQPFLVEPDPENIDPEPDPEILASATPTAESVQETPVDKSLLDQPRQFLEDYLTAPNWKDLIPQSLGSDKVAERMEAYYAENSYQPERIQEITFQHKQPLPNSKHQFYLFKVITESNPASFPMTVEETKEGYRTDWYSYVQFKDTHLQKFLENPKVGPDGKGEPRTFNVILRRAHDFTGEVPDTENKWCYKIDAPIDDPLMGGFCFIPKYSNYGQELDAKLKWLLLYFPIVELRWEVDSDAPDKPYVRLLNVKQLNWRAHDPNAADLATVEKAS